MRKIITIAKKEMTAYFASPVGYVFSAILLIVSNWLFFQDFFVANQANLGPLWNSLGFLLSIFVPALAMNALAEEKKNGNWEVMLSLPINEIELVLGKYLGLLASLVMTLALFIPTIIIVFLLGKPDLGIVIGGAFGVFMLASSYLAVGLFTSSLSNQPVVGFMSATIFLLLNSFLGQETILGRLPAFLATILGFLSISWHSNRFGDGLLQVEDLVFFGSFIIIFLIFTVLWLKARNK